MQMKLISFVLLAVGGLGGCASIVTGTSQSLSVQTISNGANVSGAQCSLTNDKGKWFVNSPGSVVVHRSYGALSVICKKPKYPAGVAVVQSSTKGMMAGNILFGGLIGGAVDASDGAAYDYPTLITVQMGKSETITAPKPKPVGKPKTTTTSASS